MGLSCGEKILVQTEMNVSWILLLILLTMLLYVVIHNEIGMRPIVLVKRIGLFSFSTQIEVYVLIWSWERYCRWWLCRTSNTWRDSSNVKEYH